LIALAVDESVAMLQCLLKLESSEQYISVSLISALLSIEECSENAVAASGTFLPPRNSESTYLIYFLRQNRQIKQLHSTYGTLLLMKNIALIITLRRGINELKSDRRIDGGNTKK
jgi:hypothetical protein